MLISTRGRYALRVLLDLAENQDKGYIAMKKVAERQELSLKYIERIMPVLSKNHYVEGVQGKGGGYRLVKNPKEYRIGDILRLTEGTLAPVACLECNSKTCQREKTCKTLPMWREFYQIINDYFDNITLADLMNGEKHRYNLSEKIKISFKIK
ncbi:MAG: RrF2 family transcriptional regulator [Firmicutes bacterium]|nr:RrF2 family transcriptional regulator [Bacillota bacterium]